MPDWSVARERWRDRPIAAHDDGILLALDTFKGYLSGEAASEHVDPQESAGEADEAGVVRRQLDAQAAVDDGRRRT